MSQIINKWVADDAIDEVKIRLSNDGYLRARNNADNGDVNLFKVNASDAIEFASSPVIGGNALLDESDIGTTVASLSGGKVPVAQLPDISITSVDVVADITARDALTVQEGDVAVVTDASADPEVTSGPASYIYDGTAWQRLGLPDETVLSVNGQTGVVSLDTDDISEGATNLYFTDTRARTAAVDDTAYGVSWDGVTNIAPSKNAVYDKIEALAAGAAASGVAGAVQFSGGSGAFSSDEDNFFWDDTNKRLGIGVTDPDSQIEIVGETNARFKLEGFGGATGNSAITLYGGNGTIASPTAIVSGDRFGGLFTGGYYDASSTRVGASIEFNATENWGVSAAGSEISFQVAPNGGTARAEALLIQQDGVIQVANLAGVGQRSVVVDASGNLVATATEDLISEGLEAFTLDGTDISNGYVDLAQVMEDDSEIVWPVGGLLQDKGVDYTVSLTGGAGGNTRITFAGDLSANLAIGDKLRVKYTYKA